MKFLVFGFEGRDKRETGHLLYAGDDGERADAELLAETPGLLRKSLIKHPQPWKNREFPVPEVAEGEEPVRYAPESKVALEVKVIDFPFVKGVIGLLMQSIEVANAKLVEAGLEPVVVVLEQELSDLSEEDLAELKKLTDLELAGKRIKELGEQLSEANAKKIASNGLAKELEDRLTVEEALVKELEANVSTLTAEKLNLVDQVSSLQDELGRMEKEKAGGDAGGTGGEKTELELTGGGEEKPANPAPGAGGKKK